MDLTRRAFVRGLGAGALTLLSPVVPGQARAARGRSLETDASRVRALFDTLSPEQRNAITFAWDHVDSKRGLLRTHVSNNWSVTRPRLRDDFYTDEQRALVRQIFESLVNPDWLERFDRQQDDDGGGFGRYQNVAIFGED